MAGARPTLILGARGLVGSALMKTLASETPLALNHTQCDLTNPDQVLRVIDRLRPRVFINAAAMTDVDGCETAFELARKINATGPGHLAQACREIDCLLVHLSTDFVFDGQHERPYTEDDRPNPLSAYGRSKLEGEQAIMKAGGRWLIVRTAWIVGPGGQGFVRKILDRAAEGGPLRVVDDQTGSPTYAPDLARGVAALISSRARGLVHLVNSGRTTWWGLARRALDLTGRQQVTIEKIKSDELNRPAHRPAWSVLDTTRYSRLTGLSPRSWEDALREALER